MGDNDVKDLTKQEVDEGDKVKDTENQENQTEQVTEKISTILDEHGYNDIDEMVTDLAESKELQKTVGNKDIKELLKAQEELQRIKEYWAEQKALEKEKEEMPDETIQRLKKEKQEIQKKFQKELSARDEAAESKKLIKQYNSEVYDTLAKEGVSKTEKDFVAKFFGVDNPYNEVDISNKVAVRRMVKDNLKDYQKFKEKIIEDYLEGKGKNPPMSKTDKSSVASSDGRVKNLKEAREALMESLTK